jgi:hypothetical protein
MHATSVPHVLFASLLVMDRLQDKYASWLVLLLILWESENFALLELLRFRR